MRICQIVLQISSGNHLSYIVDQNDLFDFENDVKVTQFELGLRLALVILCTKSVWIHQIFLQIMGGNHLENKLKVTWFELDLGLVMVLL